MKNEAYQVRGDFYKPHVTDRSIGLAKVDHKGELIDDYYGGIEWLVSSWLADTVEETIKEIAKMLPNYFDRSVIEAIKNDLRAELLKKMPHDQNIA